MDCGFGELTPDDRKNTLGPRPERLWGVDFESACGFFSLRVLAAALQRREQPSSNFGTARRRSVAIFSCAPTSSHEFRQAPRGAESTHACARQKSQARGNFFAAFTSKIGARGASYTSCARRRLCARATQTAGMRRTNVRAGSGRGEGDNTRRRVDVNLRNIFLDQSAAGASRRGAVRPSAVMTCLRSLHTAARVCSL